MPKLILLLLASAALAAQDTPERPTARVAVGTFSDHFSDSSGTWKGWVVSGDWFHDAHGPWSFSAVGTRRPEGNGTLFSLSKDHTFGENSSLTAGLSVGTGADFVPRFRGDLDLALGLQGPWSLGLAGAWNSFGGGASTTLIQAGPAWTGEVWSASARVQQLRYLPGRETDLAWLLDVRWGASNLERWHSVRLAWGHGIIDSLQPGGSTSSVTSSLGGGWGRGQGGGGTQVTTTTTTYPNLQEIMVGTTSHLPLSRRLALRMDLGWGQRESQFTLWTGTLQAVMTF